MEIEKYYMEYKYQVDIRLFYVVDGEKEKNFIIRKQYFCNELENFFVEMVYKYFFYDLVYFILFVKDGEFNLGGIEFR